MWVVQISDGYVGGVSPNEWGGGGGGGGGAGRVGARGGAGRVGAGGLA